MNIKELFWMIKNEHNEYVENPKEEAVGDKIYDILRGALNRDVFCEVDALIVELEDIHEETAFEKGFKTAVGLLSGCLKGEVPHD